MRPYLVGYALGVLSTALFALYRALPRIVRWASDPFPEDRT